MSKIQVGEAAKLARVTRNTIHRAIKTGRLSAERDADGMYHIDVAELERVYPLKTGGDAPQDTAPIQNDAGEVTALQRENQLLRDQLQDVRADRDKWQEQAARVSLLLSDQRQQPEPKKSIWERLFG
jgi:hypothetical protein